MRLDPRLRFAVYAVLAILFVSGAVWLVADRLKDSENGEAWQMVAANLLMIHGGANMAMLLLLGALVPLHLRRGWRAAKNRITGSAMASLNAALVVTAFGLYYLGAETARPWMSAVHTGCGFVLPLLLVLHVLWGRRQVRALPNLKDN